MGMGGFSERNMVVVKFGGSVLFPGGRRLGFGSLDAAIKGLKAFRGEKIIVHGTGFFGKSPAVEHGYHRDGVIDPRSVPLEKIKFSLLKAHALFMEFLLKKGLRAVSLDPAATFRLGRDLRLRDFPGIRALLSCGLVPVLRGDVFFRGESAEVVSSDEMTRAVSLAFRPERTVFITGTRGLLSPGGETVPELDNRSLPAAISGLKPSRADVSGGMKGKMAQIKKISDAGMDVLIGDPSSAPFSHSRKSFKGTFIYGKKKDKRNNSGI